MGSVELSDSFDEYADDWRVLLSTSVVSTPFQTSEWQRIWIRELGKYGCPWILRFLDDDKVLGLASLMWVDGNVTFIGDEDVCDYNDFLVPPGNEVSFYGALMEYLVEREWDTLQLYPLMCNSPTLVHFPDIARKKGCRVEISQIEVSPGKILPPTWEDYVSSLNKKDRHELRRKLRRLNAQEGVTWYSLTQPGDIELGMYDFFELMRMSGEDKARFLTPARRRFFNAVATELGELGLLRLYFMEIGSKRVAAAFTFDYGPSRMLYNSGYNPAYGYYSVGLLLNALAIESAIKDGKRYFDFLRGEEPYKYHLGGQDIPLYKMLVTRL